jgi:hypothetical protein
VSARHALVEGSWSTVRQPGPIRAFYERIRARRGHQVAIVATARKLACLFWCLLMREEDYAYAQPLLSAKKLRLLELAAGAKSQRGRRSGLLEEEEISGAWCSCRIREARRCRFAGIYGEGRSRTADTTIFSQGTRGHGLAVVAGTFLNGPT